MFQKLKKNVFKQLKETIMTMTHRGQCQYGHRNENKNGVKKYNH